MIPVEYPKLKFKLKEEAGKKYIFDELRKRWLFITPEEWVRQNFIQYLIQVENYPASYIAVEKQLTVGELKKRFDILLYDSAHQPWMMVECKASSIPLQPFILEQALRYNIGIPVPYLVITNGHFYKAYKKESGKLVELNQLPAFGI